MKQEQNKYIDIEELIIGHFDNTLNEEQEAQLAAALATSSDARQDFLAFMQMEGCLHSMGRDGFLRGPASETVPTPQPAVNHNNRSRAGWPGSLKTFTSLSACAITVLFLFWSWSLSSVSADSVLERAKLAAAKLVDRVYRLRFSQAMDTEGGSLTREFVLTVRGGGCFVIQPIHKRYIMGHDGDHYWLSRQGKSVWVSNEYRVLAPELARRIPDRGVLDRVASSDELFMLKISALLEFIKQGYEITLVSSDDEAEQHVRATRQVKKKRGPRVIDLYVEASSGVVLRAEIERAGGQTQLELIESTELPDSWYHYSEHAPNGSINHVDTTTSQ